MRKRNSWAAPAVALAAFLTLLPAAAAAGDDDFHVLVDRVSSYYQKRPMPLMGLLSFIGNRFTPRGVSHLHMAIFEDLDALRTPPSAEFDSFVQGLVGASYQPFVRVHSNRKAEQTYIYARERGKQNYEMLIVSMEPTEAVVLKIELNPDAMLDWVDEPVSSGRNSTHGGAMCAAKPREPERAAN